jgi:hypothetical protein
MTPEFDRVREAFAGSVPGKSVRAFAGAAGSAWRTSTSGRALRALARSLEAMPVAARIRTLAIAVAIAAMMQPVIALILPATVVPAVPVAAYLLVAMFSVGAAWQADALVASWAGSRLARILRR